MRGADSGFTLIEVLVATAIAAVALSATVALLGISARAVTDSELETTATWVAMQVLDEWRSSPAMPTTGERRVDRAGRSVAGVGLLNVRWTAQPDDTSGRLWRVVANVVGPRLRETIVFESLIVRAQP
jgi:prepilin-type N-terminal cleavage/methylation domain-containing protein